MKDDTLREILCAGFCSFYKPFRNEETACRGFFVIKRLIEQGINISFLKTPVDFDEHGVSVLYKSLCTACDYYRDGCDFALNIREGIQMSAGNLSKPCGGFILLYNLSVNNLLDTNEMLQLA